MYCYSNYHFLKLNFYISFHNDLTSKNVKLKIPNRSIFFEKNGSSLHIYRVFFRQFWIGETYRFLFTAKLNFDLVLHTKLQVFINKLESFLVHNMTSLIKINMHQWYTCVLTCLYIHCVNQSESYIYYSSIIEFNIFI